MSNLNEKLQNNHETGLKIPPPIFLDMEGEVLDSGENFMKIRFPVKERYQNPFGYMQGGMLVAAMDNTIGPLSFMVAPPNVTTQLNISYIRPVTAETPYIIVEATVKEQTRKMLFIEARALNPEGKVLCIAQATHQVL
ncbi:MAG: hypothetical protein Kow00117_22940 [Phototrophicales bacterium]